MWDAGAYGIGMSETMTSGDTSFDMQEVDRLLQKEGYGAYPDILRVFMHDHHLPPTYEALIKFLQDPSHINKFGHYQYDVKDISFAEQVFGRFPNMPRPKNWGLAGPKEHFVQVAKILTAKRDRTRERMDALLDNPTSASSQSDVLASGKDLEHR